MNQKLQLRRERAAHRLVLALANDRHKWKSNDGKEKAETSLANLEAKGVQVRDK